MKTCWVIGHYDEPIAVVETEADAEELFMDLVMEWQYEIAMTRMYYYNYSIKELQGCEWIWLSDGEYWITYVPNLT